MPRLDSVAAMVSYVEALNLIWSKAALKERSTEIVLLDDCVGRTVAQEIKSESTLPAFDTSAMDGYAVRSSETSTPPVELGVIGSLAAGDLPLEQNQRGAWEIMTGAPFPEGYDACVRQEDVIREGDKITIAESVSRNQNRREAGEDFRIGQTVLQKNQMIKAEDILCLAALGITNIPVYRKLRVGLIATGKELVPATEIPHGAQIRNSTTPFLRQVLRERNVVVVSVSEVGDDVEAFEKAIDVDCDLILTTGAISVGKWDFVAKSLNAKGLETYFQKVKIRPGKPLLFGRLPDGKYVMGLPGNPVATAAGFRFFVDPLLRALEGQPHERPIQATLLKATKKAKEATSFLKGWLDRDKVEAHESQKASITFALTQSNAWIALGELMPEEVPAGTLVDVYLF